MKSSAFTLFLFTGLLGYMNKIPVIRGIVAILSLYYSRTTWWKFLGKIRKIFVIFNALIGMYVVVKTTGFSFDNVLAGFSALGHQYLEIFYRFTKMLFNWFVDLFDHKVVPNVPSSKPSGGFKVSNPWGWYTKPMHEAPLGDKMLELATSSKDWYKGAFNINITNSYTPWYKEWSTWLWIGGVLCVGYLGYKIITDPLFINDLLGKKPSTPRPPTDGEDINLNDARSSIVNMYHSTINKLNPFNWFAGAYETQNNYNSFMNRQNRLAHADRRFYPFTSDNPFAPWYQKIRINLLGETNF